MGRIKLGVQVIPFEGLKVPPLPDQFVNLETDGITALAINAGLSPSGPVLQALDNQGGLVLGAPSAAVLAAQGRWSLALTPAAGVLATVTQPAAPKVTHVCTGILVTFGAIAAPVATELQWALRDGASGAGPILLAGVVEVPAAAFNAPPVSLTGLYIPGTPGNAMTLEFNALLANLREGVSLIGVDAT